MILLDSLNLSYDVFFEVNIAFLNMSVYILIGRLNIDIQITYLFFKLCYSILIFIENFCAIILTIIIILLDLFIFKLKWVIIVYILVSPIFFKFMNNIMRFFFKRLFSVAYVNISLVRNVCTKRLIYLIVKMNSITLGSIICKCMMDSGTSKFFFFIVIFLRSA